jgi:hypothetical protein
MNTPAGLTLSLGPAISIEVQLPLHGEAGEIAPLGGDERDRSEHRGDEASALGQRHGLPAGAVARAKTDELAVLPGVAHCERPGVLSIHGSEGDDRIVLAGLEVDVGPGGLRVGHARRRESEQQAEEHRRFRGAHHGGAMVAEAACRREGEQRSRAHSRR